MTTDFSPAENPKHAAGKAKASTHCIPPSALLYLGAVMEDGAAKYGAFNWGEAGIVASIYDDAIERHQLAMRTGEWLDPDDGKPHAAHIMACCAILIDCHEIGNLEEDWPVGKTAKIGPVMDKIVAAKNLSKIPTGEGG